MAQATPIFASEGCFNSEHVPLAIFMLCIKSVRCLPLERDCTRSHAAEDIRNEKISLCRLLFREDFIFADVDLGEHDLDDDHIGDLIEESHYQQVAGATSTSTEAIS